VARTQEERKAETRARLLDAAADLFARRGFHAVSTDAVAEAADRTSGAVYAHFGGKAGLLLALLDRWEHDTAERMEAALGSATSDEERLRVLWEQFAEERDGANDTWLLLEHELFLHAARDPEIGQVVAERYALARRSMGDTFDAWLNQDGDDSTLDGAELAVLVMALLLGLEMQRRLDPKAVSDELAETGLSLLFSNESAIIERTPT
jgi:AcrR family transcriptional regulator